MREIQQTMRPTVTSATSPVLLRAVFMIVLAVGSACAPSDDPAPGPTSGPPSAEPAADPVPVQPAVSTEPEVTPADGPDEPGPPWTRVVWVRDVGDGTDVISFGNRLVLMAYDSRDGQGERVALEPRASYAKPLITPSGSQIVYSLREENAVMAMNWDGTSRRRITDGFGLAVWADPRGVEWVYVGQNARRTDPPSYRRVRRYRLDRPGRGQMAWNAQPVSGDSFQLSADGRYAGALFPWPQAGVADLQNGTWEPLGEGCWTSFSGDGNDLFWYFDGSHRNVTVVDMETNERWQVPLNTAPAMNGFEVYHPRWTNDSRYFVVTGPYTVGDRANKIRGGGRQVEIWLGRFRHDYSSVAEWTQITHNDAPDFYPDAWVEPRSQPRATARRRPVADRTPVSRDAGRLVMEARVRAENVVPTPESIAPYRDGLHAIEYEVVRVLEGAYDEGIVVAAHWVIRDGRTLETAARPAGGTHRLTLEPYDAHPELEGERLVLDTTAFALPLFYDVESAP